VKDQFNTLKRSKFMSDGDKKEPTVEAPKGQRIDPKGRGSWVPSDKAEAEKLSALKEAVENKSEDALKALKEGEAAAWKKAGFWEKFKERTAQNFSHDNLGWKAARVVGTGFGGAVAFAGAKTILVSPEPQEGQEAPSFTSRLFKGGAMFAAGVAAMLFSLTKGGEARALRI
jgi:hypothetical protein